MVEELEQIRVSALAEIQSASTLQEVEELRVRHLGRRSRLRSVMAQIGGLGAEERPRVGQAASAAQKQIQEAVGRRLAAMREQAATQPLDVTLPGRLPRLGRLHPLTLLSERLIEIFRGMGFELADGPEVEDEYHNFDALNTPADHPARDLHDTFYLRNGLLLRTQTSTVQIRVMEHQAPPVRVVSLGRCYRKEAVDATHHFAFHQIEGLYVDRGVSMADLKGTIEMMARQLMGQQVRVRFRPHFFPFTEPSVEYDFSCSLCGGAQPGCRVCKGSGWIEVAGAGMVDPAVFEAVGYDPEVYTGFAFGMGLERMAMICHGIDDIRLFLESDLRFIRQF
ncbi:MAG: phenylalanine--tRNA ligase subunit alpha [Candidatus Latescibacterota bacterium]